MIITSLKQIKMSLITLSEADQSTATQLIMVNEGFRAFVYQDTTGETYQWAPGENPTWLYGLNLRVPGDPAMGFLQVTYKICTIENDLLTLKFFAQLPATVKIALFDMAYTLGFSGLIGFHQFLKALSNGKWTDASNALTQSQWYKQATSRVQKDQVLILKANDKNAQS